MYDACAVSGVLVVKSRKSTTRVMLKWLSGDEGTPGSTGSPQPPPPSSPLGAPVDEVSERLSHTEQLVSQLKELIREKDAALKVKDEQLKAEKETCEAKLSKLRLQNKAKVTSLNSQLEELKKSGAPSPTHSKKGESGEQAARGKVVLLKKKVEDLEQALSQRDQELLAKKEEVESWFRRGEEIDQMLAEKDVKLAEKEAYIVHLQTAMGGEQPTAPPTETEDSGSMVDLQNLVQNLTKKIGEMEERYSLLQEQTESFKELLSTEQEEFTKKEEMYKQNIQTFKDILLQKDQQLTEMNQKHEQELFRLAAKSDASADLEQLLKALKQKLHEKEEVLLGKNQVVDVLQGEVDTRDAQIKELMERLKRMQVEQKSLESKMEAERHVMKAQIKDLMDKHQSELKTIQHQTQEEISQSQQDLQRRLLETQAPGRPEEGQPEVARHEEARPDRNIAQLEAKVKEKMEEATKSEAKFLKIKAWSKSRIKQLEDELRKSQAGSVSLDLSSLQAHVSALEAERQENQHKLDQYEELRTINERLMAKLVVYEEQQRSLQADLEQFTKSGMSQVPQAYHRYHRYVTGTTGMSQVPQVPQVCHRYHRHVTGTTGMSQVPQAYHRYHRHVTGTTGTTGMSQGCPELPGGVSWLASGLTNLGGGAGRRAELLEYDVMLPFRALKYWRASLEAASPFFGSCSFTHVLTSPGRTRSSCSRMIASPISSLVCSSGWIQRR
uniref:Uncharacterized protein n=1 Tax=Knipowitschia caucasica TaxID=637954 RepID=A0AAV2LRP2_KNICA